VLVPDAPWLRTQLIGVADMARFILASIRSGLTGPFNVMGDAQAFSDVVDVAQQAAGHRGEQVLVAHDWLVEREVDHWMGPESLPLWVPWDLRGIGDRSTVAARAAGLTTRPLVEVAAEELAYERELGLLRERQAGLSPAYEAGLLADWDAAPRRR